MITRMNELIVYMMQSALGQSRTRISGGTAVLMHRAYRKPSFAGCRDLQGQDEGVRFLSARYSANFGDGLELREKELPRKLAGVATTSVSQVVLFNLANSHNHKKSPTRRFI